MHQNHVSHLSAWVSPFAALSAQLWIPVAFRRAAFASWFFLFPLRNSASLAVGLLRVSTTPETSLGLSCSACARCNWEDAFFAAGTGCPSPAISAPTRAIVPFIIV